MLSTLPAVFNGPTRRAQRRAPNLRIVRNAIDASDESSAEVLIYDIIDFWGVNAADFVASIKSLDVETLNVRINSPGGSVFEGLAIANALREHAARVVTHIDGLAASIASIIALAGDEIRMSDNAFFMIHDPWTFAMGNAGELRKQADVLEKIGGSLVNEYVKRTGESKAKVQQWMADETWFDAQEALDAGFVDSIDGTGEDEQAPQDLFDLSIFQHAPAALIRTPRGTPARDQPPTVREMEQALRDAGLSRSEASAVLAGGHRALRSQRDAAEGDDATAVAMESLLATITNGR